jgi:hypothetical protein
LDIIAGVSDKQRESSRLRDLCGRSRIARPVSIIDF